MQSGRNALPARYAFLAASLLLAVPTVGAPSGIAVTVLDRNGAPVADVAVYATPLEPTYGAQATSSRRSAVMDQVGNAFVPHVLVVQKNTDVRFPNNDTVSHHVYSFSEVRPFELSLYRGEPHPPVTFDLPGLVVLGCNIHDQMLGYILVVDTPYFAVTDQAGMATVETSPGTYELRIWTPRLRDDALFPPSKVAVADGDWESLTFELTTRLMPAHDQGTTSLTWDHY